MLLLCSCATHCARRTAITTIKELAQTIGVSPTTVSRVMHGRGRISSATRERVLRRIQESGYTPNANAQRLAVGRTHVIALDFGNWSSHVLADLFFVELTRYVQDALETRGYGLLLNTRTGVLQQWAKSRAIDGVILVRGMMPETELAREIADAGTPCVVIGQMGRQPIAPLPGVGAVVAGLRSGAQQAARLLVERGHRRIGFLGNDEPGDFVLAAFQEELERLDVGLQEAHMIAAGRAPDDGFCGLSTLLSQPDPPSAVLARTDALAVGALRAARVMGVAVPKDLSIIGHDDVPFAALAEPPLTTIRVHCAELGGCAVEMLSALLRQPADSPEPHVVPTELVVRESVASPPVRR